MSIPTAPETLTFTGSDGKVTTFNLVDVSSGLLTYRGDTIQDVDIVPAHAPTLTVSRRLISKNQTTRKYQVKFTFPMKDPMSGGTIGNVLIVKEISIPNDFPGTALGQPLVSIPGLNIADLYRAVDTAMANPAFVTMVAEATFPR